MTTQAAFNGYLNNRLNITSLMMRTAINDQGLTRIDDFIGLTNQDIKNLCDNIRKQGGTIPNPNATVAGQPPTITNPGQPISFVSIKRLRMLNYYLHHLRRIQRDSNEGEALPARLTMIWNLKEDEKPLEDDDLDLPPKMTDIKTVRSTLEDLDNYLSRRLGTSGLPLAYVMRRHCHPSTSR